MNSYRVLRHRRCKDKQQTSQPLYIVLYQSRFRLCEAILILSRQQSDSSNRAQSLRIAFFLFTPPSASPTVAVVSNMSDDPLLTSLCGICHIKEPQYKCPRCGARTCSLACVRKHKNWSSCSGERDPTVFIPASQLRTDRGIDHDYNFLHKLERKVETADRIFTEERGIIPPRKADPRPNKRARIHKGQSRGKNTLDDDLRPWARAALSRLRKLDIRVEHAPYGMSRAKENKTHYNHKLHKINWQVEWLFFGPCDVPTRILSKALDTVPLFEAFGECQWHRISKEEREAEKREQKTRLQNERIEGHEHFDGDEHLGLQDAEKATWQEAHTFVQEYLTCRWNSSLSDHKNQNLKAQIILHDKEKYKFFLGNPRDPAKEAKRLVPIAATDALETILAGSEVVEFPQLYVLPANKLLPNGFVSTKAKDEAKTHSKKRKSGTLVAYGTVSGSDSDLDPGPGVASSSKRRGNNKAITNQSKPEFGFESEQQRAAFFASYEAKSLQDEVDTTSSSGSDSSDAESQPDMDVD